MKLTRRRVWIAAAVFIVAMALSLMLIIASWNDRVTQANFDRLQYGMTLEQVTEIFGPTTSSISVRDNPDITTHMWHDTYDSAFVEIDSCGVFKKMFTSYDHDLWSFIKRVFGW